MQTSEGIFQYGREMSYLECKLHYILYYSQKLTFKDKITRDNFITLNIILVEGNEGKLDSQTHDYFCLNRNSNENRSNKYISFNSLDSKNNNIR